VCSKSYSCLAVANTKKVPQIHGTYGFPNSSNDSGRSGLAGNRPTEAVNRVVRIRFKKSPIRVHDSELR
jgi:hypothetical protein